MENIIWGIIALTACIGWLTLMVSFKIRRNYCDSAISRFMVGVIIGLTLAIEFYGIGLIRLL